MQRAARNARSAHSQAFGAGGRGAGQSARRRRRRGPPVCCAVHVHASQGALPCLQLGLERDVVQLQVTDARFGVGQL